MSSGTEFITAGEVARRKGFETQLDWIKWLSNQQKDYLDTPFTGIIGGDSVLARIDFGRWIADCECGGAEYVDPEEQIFYCFSCGNRTNGGNARPVVFPDEWTMRQIEDLLTERPIDDGRGRNRIERAMLAVPLYPGLGRSWNPNETIKDLERQNRVIKER